MKLIKKLTVFISLFFFSAIPTYACTFSVSPSTIVQSTDTVVTGTVSSISSTNSIGDSLSFDDNSNGFTLSSPVSESWWDHQADGGSNFFVVIDNAVQSSYVQHYTVNVGSVSTGTYQLRGSFTHSGDSSEICNANITVSSGGGGGGGGGGSVTIDPTVQANLNSGIGSLGTMIIGEVINLLPFVLGVVAVLLVIRFGMKFFKRHGR